LSREQTAAGRCVYIITAAVVIINSRREDNRCLEDDSRHRIFTYGKEKEKSRDEAWGMVTGQTGVVCGSVLLS